MCAAYSALSARIGVLWLTHESLLDSTPQPKQTDLKKLVDDRFVKAH
jgi:hypothetical protein